MESYEVKKIVENDGYYVWYKCPICGERLTNICHIDEGALYYELGYRTSCYCFGCKSTFVIKKKVLNEDAEMICELFDTKNNKMLLPWYYKKGYNNDDFVYDCIGREVLGNEQYYPICSLDEEDMMVLVEVMNKNMVKGNEK